MDLRHILERIPAHTRNNAIFTFEKGQVVRRTFATAYDDVLAARNRLAEWGVGPGRRVGIRSPNCYDWLIHDLALIELRAPIVSFTDDFANVDPAELCEKYRLSLFLAGAAERSRGWTETCIAYFGAKNSNVRVKQQPPGPEDPAFERPGYIFSSGSAGGVKGLILNRQGIESCVDAFTQAVVPRHNDRLLLFLPISNFQQRLMYYSAFWYGFDLIVTEPVHLFRALSELKPTILIAPPALYETFETRFCNLPESKQRLAKTLGGIAGAVPVEPIRQRLGRLIFRQAHEALGGHMRFMVTGMAPIKRSTLELFSLMQLPLYETYGLIESGSVALNLPGKSRPGSVGKLLPGVKVDFTSENEILVRRDHPIAVGYFECAEGENERTFLQDGAVATGDIGRFDNDGYLYLIGRKKEIIVTGGGEKIHPEVVEADLNSCPDVERAVILGRDHSASLAAVIRSKQPGDAGSEDRIQQYVAELNKRLTKVSIGKVIFTDVVFTRENQFLRPNLKLDRTRINAHFRPETDEKPLVKKAAEGGR